MLREHQMSNKRHSAYRGCLISTHCVETTPPAARAEEASPIVWAPRFTASFSVRHETIHGHTSWQEFPEASFRCCDDASQYALTEAKRGIDLKFAEM
jgi:hypothetical protein